MVFTPTAAAAYLQNFKPVGKVPGFKDVKEDRFSEGLMTLPALQFAAEMQMAQAALGAKADLIERKMINENVMDQLEFQQAAQNKASKRALALKLLSGGSSGKSAKIQDPRVSHILDERYEDELHQRIEGRREPTTGYVPNEAADALIIRDKARTKQGIAPATSSPGFSSPDLPNVMSSEPSALEQAAKKNPKLFNKILTDYYNELGEA